MLILTWGHREPRTIKFSLGEKGITLGNEEKVFPYTDITNFSAEEGGGRWSAIILHFKKKFRPTLNIKAPREKFVEIEKALQEFVPKIETDKSLAETIAEFIRF